MNLHEWAAKWNIPYAAIHDFQVQCGMVNTDPAPTAGTSETAVQSQVRLNASASGMRLWRNNVGAVKTETGLLRFGLCNESKQINDRIKSSDLIGIRPVIITPQHVGATVGQFVAREVKRAGWKYTGTKREAAQLAFINLVLSMGGDAGFTTGG